MVDSSDKARKAFQYLMDNGKLHSQQDLADAMVKDKGYISKMLKPGCATGTFFQDLCKTFPGIFNLNYFLNGEGEMLISQKVESPSSDGGSVVLRLLDMLKDKDAQLDDMRRLLQSMDQRIQKLERAHYGYASVAADGGIGIDEKEFVDVK